MRTITLAVLALSLPVAAQKEAPFASRFHVQFGLSGGEFEHRTDGSALDDDADAGMLRLAFEGFAPSGIGGGVRFEGLKTDDDLFESSGFNSTEARMGSIFAHFSYRATARRFAMPVRVGLWLNGYTLEDQVLDEEITYGSIGPYVELAPEFYLVDKKQFSWSLYGEFGAGVAATAIDVDNDGNDYTSATVAFGVEFGTRLRTGPIEFGIAGVNRWQSMDESDDENGLVVLGYDAEYHGVLISFGARF